MRVNAEGVTTGDVHWFNICRPTPFNTLYLKIIEYIFTLKAKSDVKMTGIPHPGVPMDTHLTDSS